MALSLSREQVLAFRVRAQQLDRDGGTVDDTVSNTMALDLGVQDTGRDGGRWALALRGVTDVPVDDLALVWTIRGAPHFYRRADLPAVAAATAPFSDADAAKRIYDAARPLRAAGIGILDALDEIAGTMRSVVTRPTVKGEVSRQVSDRLPEPYLRFCRPCQAVHLYEQPFRLAALRGGLELQSGTSPPVLQRSPGPDAGSAPGPIAGPAPGGDVPAPGGDVPARLDVVRACLRLLGPATPKQVAGYLDSPVGEVRARWPRDATEVTVAGETRWLLAEDADALAGTADGPPSGVRLLGPFDLFLQARDRDLLVPDRERAKTLWPVLGRPGGVLVDGEVVGAWRARRTGASTSVTVDLWAEADRARIEEQAERLAAFRGSRLAAFDVHS